MGTADRERELLDAFVDLADTLVRDYDVAEFLYMLSERCHRVLDVDAVGVLLSHDGRLHLTAASTEDMAELEVFEVQKDQGPCVDAFRQGTQVFDEDLSAARDRWPQFAPKALGHGHRSVCALPLRLRDERIGALNMFRRKPGPFPERDVRTAQALADVATIGILQERNVRQSTALSGQLQRALDSRVVIEQAKGVVATQQGVSMREAFEAIRRHARSNGRRLAAVSQDIVNGDLRLGDSDAA